MDRWEEESPTPRTPETDFLDACEYSSLSAIRDANGWLVGAFPDPVTRDLAMAAPKMLTAIEDLLWLLDGTISGEEQRKRIIEEARMVIKEAREGPSPEEPKKPDYSGFVPFERD